MSLEIAHPLISRVLARRQCFDPSAAWKGRPASGSPAMAC
jgi:hypothetical protein